MYCSNDDTLHSFSSSLAGIYLMRERTDYAEQTFGVNAINDQEINATRRIICYDQPIYDDRHLEVSE